MVKQKVYGLEAIVLCCEIIASSARQLGFEQYNRHVGRWDDNVAQLERINELKAKLYNLEITLEKLYADLNAHDIEVDDDCYLRTSALLLGI